MLFSHFMGLYDETRIDPVIVGHLEPPVARALGAKVTRVFLSAETIAKQKERHPDIAPKDYQILQPALVFGEYRQDSPTTAVVLFVDAKMHDYGTRTYLKATQCGREIYVVSFCFLRKKGYAREVRKPFPVIRQHANI